MRISFNSHSFTSHHVQFINHQPSIHIAVLLWCNFRDDSFNVCDIGEWQETKGKSEKIVINLLLSFNHCDSHTMFDALQTRETIILLVFLFNKFIFVSLLSIVYWEKCVWLVENDLRFSPFKFKYINIKYTHTHSYSVIQFIFQQFNMFFLSSHSSHFKPIRDAHA